MSRPPVSLCVVAMNEEDRIEACLRSADFVDERILVDSHSTDRTREIAASLGARVIERDWAGYVAQKNFAIDQATHDWVLVLDADEWLAPEARAVVLAALERHQAVDGFELNRRTRALGRWIRHGGWYPDRKLRLFRRSLGRFHGTDPHDRVRVEGRVEAIAADILHEPYRSISDHLRTIDAYTTIAARQKRVLGQKARLIDITLRPLGKFVRMYVLERGFLDGLAGFVLAITGAYYVFLKYVKLRFSPDDLGRVDTSA
ncbi:MAG: glycosyltransferase family 2 protein [Gemmatimonadetes bacterium]|nr:glycosyltransferase family 2 protein [Gemmatimonadota bacterium]